MFVNSLLSRDVSTELPDYLFNLSHAIFNALNAEDRNKRNTKEAPANRSVETDFSNYTAKTYTADGFRDGTVSEHSKSAKNLERNVVGEEEMIEKNENIELARTVQNFISAWLRYLLCKRWLSRIQV